MQPRRALGCHSSVSSGNQYINRRLVSGRQAFIASTTRQVQTRTSGSDESDMRQRTMHINQSSGRASASSKGGHAQTRATQGVESTFENLSEETLQAFSSPDSSGEEEPQVTFVGADPFSSESSTSMDGQFGQFPKNTFEVMRLERNGRIRQIYARRRDLLREHKLQPRDLRRIDPSVDINKTPPSITVKDNVIVVCLGGIRAIVTGEKALIFEPHAPASVKFVEVVKRHLKAQSTINGARSDSASGTLDQSLEHREYMSRFYSQKNDRQQDEAATPLPFELEIVESSLMMATGLLDSQMANVSRRVQNLLSKLPHDINPLNLEELRKVKGALVDLEQRADTLRNMLEELLDDEDELRELNLSSRPKREERQKQREREKLERELERAREIKEEIEERLEDDEEGQRNDKVDSDSELPDMPLGLRPSHPLPPSLRDFPSPSIGQQVQPSLLSSSSSTGGKGVQVQGRIQELRTKFDRARLSELRANFNWPQGDNKESSDPESTRRLLIEELSKPSGGSSSRDEREGWISRLDDSVEDIQEAQEALEEMVEQEEEEQEVEEVEDLLEYYLQKASATQDEAEKLLAGARDLEESIGVSLSARRYEVNRLELTLSIGSFAAAVGAMIAGIFGMNMRSSLEHSVHSFWGVGLAIVLGCLGIFAAVLAYTRKRRIL